MGILSSKVFGSHIENAEKIVEKKQSDQYYGMKGLLGGYDKLPTDEKILIELIKVREGVNENNEKLSNLKWVIWSALAAIFLTLKFGL